MKQIKEENFIATDKDIINAGYHSNELLPCPFCGNKNIMSAGWENENTQNVVYKVFCNDTFKCGAEVFTCLGKIDTAEAARMEVIAKWNRRTI